MNKYLLAICVLFLALNCSAQKFADTTASAGASLLKTMSSEQYKAYVDGVDINNVALVAKLNHYPDPDKVVLLKKELILNTQQFAQLTAITTELKRKMKEMGMLIIKNETALDNLFHKQSIDDGSLIFYSQRTDLYRGEMRNAILQAYIKVKAILSTGQLKKYEDLQKGP